MTAAELKRYEHQVRIDLVVREQQLHYRTIRIGQFSALVISLSFLASATYLISAGFTISGTILGTVDMVALAVVFLTVGRSGGTTTLPPGEEQRSRDSRIGGGEQTNADESADPADSVL